MQLFCLLDLLVRCQASGTADKVGVVTSQASDGNLLDWFVRLTAFQYPPCRSLVGYYRLYVVDYEFG